MIGRVVDVHKASDGGIPTDFTGSRASKEGSLRLDLERVKLARRDGASEADLGIYQGDPKIGTPCGLVGVGRGRGQGGHTGYRRERGYELASDLITYS